MEILVRQSADVAPDRELPMIPPLKPQYRLGALSEVRDYNHDRANIPEAWKTTMGKGVKIAILDSGVPKHIDLSVEGGHSFIDGYYFDKCYHATFVGGITSAIANNGIGVRGIAPEAVDYYGAVLNATGSGTVEQIVRGIYWAVDEIGADVINMSLGITGSYRPDRSLEKACNYANEHGTVLFASAGNDALSVNYPAKYDSVVAVAAVDRNNKVASFSSHGPEVEFAAGGVDVLSTYKDNGYASMSGTSFSCPVVASVGALILSQAKSRNEKISPEELRRRLKLFAYDVGPAGWDEYTGHGIPVFTKDCFTAEAETVRAKPGRQSFLTRLLNKLKLVFGR